jgi:mannose-6-phosphate isomerase-like protein (cupin superfamily)
VTYGSPVTERADGSTCRPPPLGDGSAGETDAPDGLEASVGVALAGRAEDVGLPGGTDEVGEQPASSAPRTTAAGRPSLLASRAMDAFELAELRAAQRASGRLYHEFIRTHDLSVGLYVLPAGGTDPQGPHTEDEVYYVVEGRGRITVGDDEREVMPGSTVFVGADVRHRFHDIAEELVLLVVFGPAEYTHRVDHERGQPHGAASA